MAGSVLDRPEVRVDPDLAQGTWTVGLPPAARPAYRVRGWTWGERRRLVDSCVVGSSFDRERFVGALVQLLVEPRPPAEDAPVLAATALRLLGIEPDARPPSLLRSEAVLAATWGWGPVQLDPQPADRIDRHLMELAVSATSGTTTGWNEIEVVDG
jgi:hypothetical protein